MGSPTDVRSFARRQEWFAQEEQPREQEWHFLVPLTNVDLMARLQRFLTRDNFKWFHPSDTEIVARDRAPGHKILGFVSKFERGDEGGPSTDLKMWSQELDKRWFDQKIADIGQELEAGPAEMIDE
jgi:hypothetical protein